MTCSRAVVTTWLLSSISWTTRCRSQLRIFSSTRTLIARVAQRTSREHRENAFRIREFPDAHSGWAALSQEDQRPSGVLQPPLQHRVFDDVDAVAEAEFLR